MIPVLAVGALALVLLWVLVPPPLPAGAPVRASRSRRAPSGPLDLARTVEQLASVISSGDNFSRWCR